MTTSCESLWATKFSTFIASTNLKPEINASYFASLLEGLKVKPNAYSTVNPSGPWRINPAPVLVSLEEPSTNNIHFRWVTSGICSLDGGDLCSWSVHSTIKSARAWAFKEGRGQNYRSNSPNLITHLTNLPELSGLYKIVFDGSLVNTVMK